MFLGRRSESFVSQQCVMQAFEQTADSPSTAFHVVIASAKAVMFYLAFVCLFVCLSVCLSVSQICINILQIPYLLFTPYHIM